MAKDPRTPTHPGAILREDVIPATGLTVKAFAAALGVSRQQLHRLMSEEAGVSPEMALRLGKVCGNGPDLWLGMQTARDLYLARVCIADELETLTKLET